MTKEQVYTQQMKELGTYQPIFDPEIKTLCELERDLQRLSKRWKEAGRPTVEKGRAGPPTSDKTLDAIMALRKEILAHRDALGLTPKGLQRLKPKGAALQAQEQQNQTDGKPTVLELVQAQARRKEA